MTACHDIVALRSADGDSRRCRASTRNGSGPGAPTPEPPNECSSKGKRTQDTSAREACNTPAPGGVSMSAPSGGYGQDPFDLVVSGLADVKPTPRGVRARCPVHEGPGSTPSLDVDRGEDGRVLIRCRFLLEDES